MDMNFESRRRLNGDDLSKYIEDFEIIGDAYRTAIVKNLNLLSLEEMSFHVENLLNLEAEYRDARGHRNELYYLMT